MVLKWKPEPPSQGRRCRAVPPVPPLPCWPRSPWLGGRSAHAESAVVDGSTAVVKTRTKLSDAPLPPSSPTIQPPARSTRNEGEVRERADVMGGTFCGPYVRVHDRHPPGQNSRDNPIWVVVFFFLFYLT